MSGVRIDGRLNITEETVLGILDDEARTAVTEATSELAAALDAAAPKGPTGRLSRSHSRSVRRTHHGYRGTIRRKDDAWYGRIVERGRAAGVSFRSGKARRYPAAKANPFVARTYAALEGRHEEILLAGGERAGVRIAQRL